jgi:hypothetical protein
LIRASKRFSKAVTYGFRLAKSKIDQLVTDLGTFSQ